VSTSDYSIERQPEIAIWPPKPEIVILLELQQIASKFQQQVRDFRPWRARIKCRQVIATMTDNCNLVVFLANLAISGSQSLSQSFG